MSVSDRIRALWNFDDPQASEQAFGEAEAAATDEAARQAFATQRARALGMQQRYAEGHAVLDALEAPAGEVAVRVALERGRLHRSGGQADAARAAFATAWREGRALGADGLAIDAAHTLAIVAPTADDAIAWTDRGLQLAARSADPHASKWVGPLSNNLGWSLHDAGRYEEALTAWQTCLAFHAARDTGKGHRIARWTVARGLRSLGRCEEALPLQQALLEERLAMEPPEGLAYSQEEVGECLLALGRRDEARPHLVKALAGLRADPWHVEHDEARIARLADLVDEGG